MNKYIQNLISEGEHERLDFKFSINDSKKIARSMAAFSNSKGGKLLIGVKDNGKSAGVNSDEEYYMAEAAAQIYCKPVVDFNAVNHFVNGKTVLEISISPGQEKPYQAPDETGKYQTYIRIADENIVADRVQTLAWKIQTLETAIRFNYSEKETVLVDYLKQNEVISVIKLSRIAMLSEVDAEKLMAYMLVFNVVYPIHTDTGFVYALVNN